MECIYSKECPFKSKSKNYLEISLLLNLQVMFAASSYNSSNTIAVNVMVSLAFVKFTCSILQNNMSSKQVWKSFVVKIVKITSLMQSQPVHRQCDIELLNKIPEVKYNYKEFQEPLIGQDS